MSGKNTSPVLPAQARLLKLKKELKEKKKYTPYTSSRMSASSEAREGVPGITEDFNLNINNVKNMEERKSSDSKVSFDPSNSLQKTAKNSQRNTKQRNSGKIYKCKDERNISCGKKRAGSNIAEASSSKDHDENTTNNLQPTTITAKIRKIIGMLSTFSGSNKAEKMPNNKSCVCSQETNNKNKKKISPKKPSSLSTTEKTLYKKSPCQNPHDTIEKNKKNFGLKSDNAHKKKSPKTTTGNKNLFKRKKNQLSDGNNSKLSESAEVILKNIVKNPKLSDLPDVNLKKISSIPSPASLNPEKRIPMKNKKSVKVECHNYSLKSAVSSQGAEYENYVNMSTPAVSVVHEIPLNEMNNNFAEEEAMEWEPTKEYILRSIRDEIYAGNIQEFEAHDRISEISINKEGNKSVYFVVDTNVLIQSLNLIKQIATTKIRGFAVVVMIPWQVLKELDKLKSARDHCVANCARKASKFLSEFQSEDYNIIFQKQSKHIEDCPPILVEVPDDHLIKCCCQLMNDNKNVILLSNDNNLRAKASATGRFPSVPDSWASAIIRKDSLPRGALHCFENEPKEILNESTKICAQFLHRITRILNRFLFDVIRYAYEKKHGDLYELWLPSCEMPLKECFVCAESLTLLEPYKNKIKEVWNFYVENKSYVAIKAIDVEKLGINCILLAKSLHPLVPDISFLFDKDMGFLKTGNFSESEYSYTSASSKMAQLYFKRMEDKFNSNLAYLNQLVSKMFSQNVLIPDTRPMLNMIDKNLNVANEASTAFLLMNENEEMPLDTPEIIIFHKVLLNFLDVNQDGNTLPLFTPEDIVIYINQERSFLNPAAIQWLSDVRRQFTEYKSVLRDH